jgi:hypothetical protein
VLCLALQQVNLLPSAGSKNILGKESKEGTGNETEFPFSERQSCNSEAVRKAFPLCPMSWPLGISVCPFKACFYVFEHCQITRRKIRGGISKPH